MEKPELAFQHKVIANSCTQQAKESKDLISHNSDNDSHGRVFIICVVFKLSLILSCSDCSAQKQAMTKLAGKKQEIIVLDDDSEERDTAPPHTCLHVINIYHYVNATIVAKQHPHTSFENPVEKDSDGLLINIDIQPIDDDPSSSASNKWQDIDNFFLSPS